MTDFFTELFEKPGRPRTHFGVDLTPEDKKELTDSEDSEDKKADQD